jgi:serine O-acetyltransferase
MVQPLRDLIAILKEDWEAHGRDWTRPGFRALAVFRFGAWKQTIETRLWRAPLSVVHRALYRRMRNRYGIEIPHTVTMGRKVVFEHQGGVVIHGGAVIGDGCIIRQGVTIGARHLESPADAPTIGDFVNIGAGAAIIGKVRVGSRVNVGANSVVLDDVPPGATAVGVPARLIVPGEWCAAADAPYRLHGR